MLPRRVGEEECSKIAAGENVLVIKTPKGLYIRTKKGRIYAVNPGIQSSISANAGWRHSPVTMSSWQPSTQSVYTADDMWPHGSSASVQCNDRMVMSSLSAGNMYSLQSPSASGTPLISVPSSDDICNIDPMSFLNTATLRDGNVGWDSCAADAGRSVMSGEMEATLSSAAMYSRDSGAQQSYSCAADLPADLLCLDASSVADTTDVSLPALTIRDQQTDSCSLDSLTFDDCDAFPDSFTPCIAQPCVAPVFRSPLYSIHSDGSIAAPSTAAAAASATSAGANNDVDILDVN